jgi:hypothetical protein
MEHTVRQELIAGYVCGFIGKKKLQNKLRLDRFVVLSEE